MVTVTLLDEGMGEERRRTRTINHDAVGPHHLSDDRLGADGADLLDRRGKR